MKLKNSLGVITTILVIITLFIEIFSKLKPLSKYVIPFMASNYYYIGGVAFIVFVIILLIFIYKKRRKKKRNSMANKVAVGGEFIDEEDYEKFEKCGR